MGLASGRYAASTVAVRCPLLEGRRDLVLGPLHGFLARHLPGRGGGHHVGNDEVVGHLVDRRRVGPRIAVDVVPLDRRLQDLQLVGGGGGGGGRQGRHRLWRGGFG